MSRTDATRVAALHAASWQSAYRHILTAEYLHGAVEQERADAWCARLDALDDARQFGVVAEQDGSPVGFVFVVGHADARYGTLIDNLHVAATHRSAGIGPQLLDAAASEIAIRGWGRAVHLWVYDANVRARAFYARIGGREVETVIKPTVDGGTAREWRVVWDDAQQLRLPRARP